MLWDGYGVVAGWLQDGYGVVTGWLWGLLWLISSIVYIVYGLYRLWLGASIFRIFSFLGLHGHYDPIDCILESLVH